MCAVKFVRWETAFVIVFDLSYVYERVNLHDLYIKKKREKEDRKAQRKMTNQN